MFGFTHNYIQTQHIKQGPALSHVGVSKTIVLLTTTSVVGRLWTVGLVINGQLSPET